MSTTATLPSLETAQLPEVRTIANIERHIAAYFPTDSVVVKRGTNKTYLLIKTSLVWFEAMKRLDLFDEEWWINHMDNKICVTLDFETTNQYKTRFHLFERGTSHNVAL